MIRPATLPTRTIWPPGVVRRGTRLGPAAPGRGHSSGPWPAAGPDRRRPGLRRGEPGVGHHHVEAAVPVDVGGDGRSLSAHSARRPPRPARRHPSPRSSATAASRVNRRPSGEGQAEPRPARCRAVARPMPVEPPVISALRGLSMNRVCRGVPGGRPGRRAGVAGVSRGSC